MRKILILLSIIFTTLNIYSNNFWNNDHNYKQILTVESIISYSPSVVNYVYGNYNHWEIKYNYNLLKKNNDLGYYFSDSVQWNHMFNIFPIFQFGIILQYEWFWGLRCFSFTNLYRICGLNIDLYNLSLNISTCDSGYTFYKYKWTENLTGHNNQFCFLISPITAGISYRIHLNKKVSILINCGYSMRIIIDNKIMFPQSNIDASMLFQHSFNSGIGFRFYTKNFKE